MGTGTKTFSQLKRAIDQQTKRIAKERDKLRELIEEAQAIAENCDNAIDNLERAADCLSELL